ncbi:MAG: hypothetical protein PHQ75_12940, partial [Thermoguttaceae bacterium]|nr:hypothetical protein [Thermoguttaceae bacterium]
MRRRDFLETAGTAAMIGLASGTTLLANSDNNAKSDFHFTTPYDGGIIHVRHGDPVLGTEIGKDGKPRLRIRVAGIAPEGSLVEIFCPCGQKFPAKRNGKEFFAEVLLSDRISEIKAVCRMNGHEQTIRTRPVWAKNSFKRYKFQIDDNICFLYDLYQKKYDSLFDSFYLAGLKRLHEKYNCRFGLNCFYKGHPGYDHPEDFNLTMISDRYKGEWEKNSDWLHVTFHALTSDPGRPYHDATPEKLAADFDLTAKELKRIAGCAYAPPGIIHFGDCRPEAYKVLADRGCRCLSGYFWKGSKDWIVSWQLPEDVCNYLLDHEGWMHFETGLTFSRLEMVCNLVPVEKTVPMLTKSIECPQTAEVIDFLTHEPQFWPNSKILVPDHFQ